MPCRLGLRSRPGAVANDNFRRQPDSARDRFAPQQLDQHLRPCPAEFPAWLVNRRQGRIDGLVTDRDLVVRVHSEGRDPARTPVADVMTRNPRTVSADASIEEAADTQGWCPPAAAFQRPEGHPTPIP